MWLLVWTFIKKNWLLIIVGILAVAMFSRYEFVRIERDHYKAEVSILTKQAKDITDQINVANLRTASLEKASQQKAEELTKKYQDYLTQIDNLLDANLNLRKDLYAKDKELTSVKLSLNAVRMFNRTTEVVPQPDSETTNPKSTNDGDSSTTAKTLADLYQVIDYNNQNHLKCIAQVQAWQNFWKDFSEGQKNADQP